MSKALFWDFDGTLVYPDKRWSEKLSEAVKNHGYEIPYEEIRYYLNTGYSWHYPEISYAGDSAAMWWVKFFSHFDSLYEKYKIPQKAFFNINMYFRDQILNSKNYRVYEDAVSTLKKCIEMGYKNYILSNNFPELSVIADGLKLSEYVDFCIASANVGYEKPRVEIFNYALRVAEFPDICYMIGDNQNADITGGKNSGMRTVFVHGNIYESDADYSCRELSFIPDILEC